MLKTRKTESGAQAVSQKSVLILDDNPERHRLARTALSGAGYFAQVAAEAVGALAKLAAIRPDLIVVDLQLPGMDGLPLARGLLLDSDLESVPIVAIAATIEEISHRKELSDLFDGYVCDPIEGPALLGTMQEVLAKGSPGKTPATPAAPPNSANPLDNAGGILAGIEQALPESQFAASTGASLKQLAASAALRDYASLGEYLRRAQKVAENRTARAICGFRCLIRLCRERLDGGPDPTAEFDHLRSDYIKNRIRELPGLADALRSSDFKKLSTGGHNIKGTGAAYGFAELTDLGRALETASKANRCLEIEVLLGKMELYLKLVSPSASP